MKIVVRYFNASKFPKSHLGLYSLHPFNCACLHVHDFLVQLILYFSVICRFNNKSEINFRQQTKRQLK